MKNTKKSRFSKKKEDTAPTAAPEGPKLYKTGDTEILGITITDPDKPCAGQKKEEDNTPIQARKNLLFNETRFSNFETEYMLDILSPLWEKSFLEEASAAFVAFQELNNEPIASENAEETAKEGEEKTEETSEEKKEEEQAKEEKKRKQMMKKRLVRFNRRFLKKEGEEENKETTEENKEETKEENKEENKEEEEKIEPSVTLNAIHAGLKKFKWEQEELTPEAVFSKYTAEKHDNMNVRAVILMSIEFSVKNIKMENCEHCFKKTKEKIDEFFAYLDCDHSRLINA